jgi:dipeptidyl aminopeptidase/acylaminoacyl peptidase
MFALNFSPSAADEIAADAVPVIPLEILFGNPDIDYVRMSPDGAYVSWLAPYEGVMNIWVRTIGSDDDNPVTTYTDQAIDYYYWTYSAGKMVFLLDNRGDEHFRMYTVDIEGNIVCVTPEETEGDFAIRSGWAGASPTHPDEILIYMNLRGEWLFDHYLLDLETGNKQIVMEGENPFEFWLADNDLVLRSQYIFNADGSKTLLIRDNGEDEPVPLYEWSFEDSIGTGQLCFTGDNDGLVMVDSTDRDTSALVLLNLEDGTVDELLSDPDYDISFGNILLEPYTNAVQAIGVNRDRVEWEVLDESVRADVDYLASAHRGDFQVLTRSLDDSLWLISYVNDDGPVDYYIYGRETGGLEFQFSDRPQLSELPLTTMEPIRYTARDGLEIHGYLSIPREGTGWSAPGPMVLYVHGGPQVRENREFNPKVQWLTNRGYAVLIVNYRGSAGFGKEFRNMGNREWGGAMQDDLTDAVLWAIGEGIADPGKVVIFGRSYGGYAALAGLAFTPELYAGGVEMVGICNLITFLESEPLYGRDFLESTIGRLPYYEEGDRLGEVKDEADWTEQDRADMEFLISRSPIFHLDNVRAPLLIAAGANDTRVPIDEANQLVTALTEREMDVEYVIYDDEGHFFNDPENRLDFYRRADQFLARILGGRCE